MQSQALKELFVDELRDLYNAENQLIKALPKMAKAANSEELSSGFEAHLEQTKGHVQRLEQVFETLGEKASGKKCKAMEGLIAEGSEVIDFAEMLGQDEAVKLLEQTLEEETETDEKLVGLIDEFTVEGSTSGDEEEEESDNRVTPMQKKARSAKA